MQDRPTLSPFFLPETQKKCTEPKKVRIETYGCQMNVADSEVVAAMMSLAGYEPTELDSEAAAVLINTLGYALGAVISYYRGRSAGDETIEQLMGRYPRLCAFVRGNESGNLFLSFILRVIGMVPMDVSSMYLGSTRVPFLPYLLATVAGALPKVAAITLVGDSITEPGSPAFLLSAAFTVALTLLSSLFFLWYRKKQRDQGTGR